MNNKKAHFGAWTLCFETRSLTADGITRECEPLIFDLLVYFINQPKGSIIARQTLVEDVWQQSFVDDNAINRAMSELRKALKHPSQHTQYIKTHYKKGYSLLPEVHWLNETTAPLASEGASNEAAATQAGASQVAPLQAGPQQAKDLHIAANTVKTDLNTTSASTEKASAKSTHSSTQAPHALTAKAAQHKKPLYFIGLSLLLLVCVWVMDVLATLSMGLVDEELAARGHLSPKHLSASRTDLLVNQTNLLQLKGLAFAPKVNKEATLLAYSHRPGIQGYMGLRVKNLQTQADHPLVALEGDLFPVTWGKNQLLFSRINRVDGEVVCDVWRISVTSAGIVSSEPNKLLDCHSQYGVSGALINQGKTLVYSKYGYRGKTGLAALVARDLRTGKEFQVTSPPLHGQGDYFVIAAPDESSLVFVRSNYEQHTIYQANLDGSEQTQVMALDYPLTAIHWQGEGNQLHWLNPRDWTFNHYELDTHKLTQSETGFDYAFNHMIGIEMVSPTQLVFATDYLDKDIVAMPLAGIQESLNSNQATPLVMSSVKESLYTPFHQRPHGLYVVETAQKSLWLDDGVRQQKLHSLDVDALRGLAITPDDSQYLVAGSQTVTLYDSQTHTQVKQIEFDSPIKHVSWLSNHALLMSKRDGQRFIIGQYLVDEARFEPLSPISAIRAQKVGVNKLAILDDAHQLHVIDRITQTTLFSFDLSETAEHEWVVTGSHLYYSISVNEVHRVALQQGATPEHVHSFPKNHIKDIALREGAEPSLIFTLSSLATNSLFEVKIQNKL